MRPLRHGYTNDTRGDGSVVVKRFTGPDASARWATERDMLELLAGRLPVPALLAAPTGELHLAHLAGTHGQELIDAGHAGPVLRSCGAMLHRLAAAGVTHGDYGPNNILLDAGTCEITGILDWEWARRGGTAVDDLAWCEWIVRMHHPGAVDALPELFDGYGSRPPWPERRAAMLTKCREMLALRRTLGATDPGLARWARAIATTTGWSEVPGRADGP
jgi:aminoglycoside phosphotransferase (APT) family kinase protein